MRVVNCSTASQYFHVLRSQMRRPFRKPLVVVAPKKLLKLRAAGSDIEEFGEGLRFKKVIGDTSKTLVPADKVRKVIFCSGQVFYDLENHREKNNIKDVAIVRVEQLAPFPFHNIEQETSSYKNARFMWVQEEPKNQGPFDFVRVRLNNWLEKRGGKQVYIDYSGRSISASTATGYGKQHNAELAQLLEGAFK